MPEFRAAVPDVATYLAFRAEVGFSRRSPDGAATALANSLYAVWLWEDERLIGMGRVIGDGGCFVQLNDIAVAPHVRGQGWGRAIVTRLVQWCDATLPPRTFVNLIAHADAAAFYERLGFFRCQGMGRYVDPDVLD